MLYTVYLKMKHIVVHWRTENRSEIIHYAQPPFPLPLWLHIDNLTMRLVTTHYRLTTGQMKTKPQYNMKSRKFNKGGVWGWNIIFFVQVGRVQTENGCPLKLPSVETGSNQFFLHSYPCNQIGISRSTQPYTNKKVKKIFLIYKEIKRDRVQSHIWLPASSYMGKNLCIPHTLGSPIPSEFPYIWGKFCFLF